MATFEALTEQYMNKDNFPTTILGLLRSNKVDAEGNNWIEEYYPEHFEAIALELEQRSDYTNACVDNHFDKLHTVCENLDTVIQNCRKMQEELYYTDQA